MKTYSFFLFLLVYCFSAIGQDTASVHRPRIGVYKTAEEFLAGTPSVTKPFAIDKKYYILNTDTVITGYTYRFADSTPIVKNGFGIYDGEHFYVMDKKGNLERLDQAGKHPYKFYASVNTGKLMAGDFIVAGLVGIAGRFIDGALFPKDMVIYLNKKGKFLEATPQSIGVLLRGDKDLLKEYEKEKKYTTEVFIKYLQKMNERYPL